MKAVFYGFLSDPKVMHWAPSYFPSTCSQLFLGLTVSSIADINL